MRRSRRIRSRPQANKLIVTVNRIAGLRVKYIGAQPLFSG